MGTLLLSEVLWLCRSAGYNSKFYGMFSNKLKWILGISMVFLLIIATNYVDRSNFRRVKNSIETIYEDRLVAQDLVFKMSRIVKEKELRFSKTDSIPEGNRENQEMDELLAQFHETRLTPGEATCREKFERDVGTIVRMEQSGGDYQGYRHLLDDLNENIMSLSKVQMDEGKRQLFEGEKALRSVDLLTTIEVYVLVFLAILIQIIVIYNPRSQKA